MISGIARTWKRLSQYVISMNYNYDADDRTVRHRLLFWVSQYIYLQAAKLLLRVGKTGLSVPAMIKGELSPLMVGKTGLSAQ